MGGFERPLDVRFSIENKRLVLFRQLSSKFQITDLGPCSFYLYMQARRDKEREVIPQSKIVHQKHA